MNAPPTPPAAGLGVRPAAVLFDCDGVLADSEHLVNRLVAEDLAPRGWCMSPAEARETFLGLTLPAMIPMIEARTGASMPHGWPDDFKRRVADVMAREVSPVPGAADALGAVRAAGLPMAMASNSSRAELVAKLGRLGFGAFFEGRVFCFEDVARSKPHPDMYLAAAAACGAAPAACVVVEDSPLGARAGVAAGCRVLGFCRETEPTELRAAGVTAIFRDMRELPALLGLKATS